MRLTTRTNLAIRTLMACAVNADKVVRRHEIALCCNASENHLAQVVNMLGQLGYLATQRGRTGGLRLARPATEIRIGHVFRVFETGTPFAECFEPESNTCPLVDVCLLRPALAASIEAFYRVLDRLTLADLVKDNRGLQRILALPPNGGPLPCSVSAPPP